MESVQTVFKVFYNELGDPFGRDHAWECCYTYFGKDNLKTDIASLHLHAYLANFGMFRNSKLLGKYYLVHAEPIEKIISKHKVLRRHPEAKNDLSRIIGLKKELREYYKSISVSSTDTMMSKIILATLGCVPAYDQIFSKGLRYAKENKICDVSYSFNERSLKSLHEFYERKEKDFKIEASKLSKTGCEYPPMRMIDLYFWYLGKKTMKVKKSKRFFSQIEQKWRGAGNTQVMTFCI